MSKTIENTILGLTKEGCNVRAWLKSENDVVLKVKKQDKEKWIYIVGNKIVATL